MDHKIEVQPMLSRLAENIYWMNRYIERVENNARLALVNLNSSFDHEMNELEQWLPLIMTTGNHEYFKQNYYSSSQRSTIEFLVFDPRNPNSILNCLTNARENAKGMKEMISSEIWDQINENYLYVKDHYDNQKLFNVNLIDFFKHIIRGSHLYLGLMDSTLNHYEAWHFGILGRYLERADNTTRLLDMKYFYLLPSENSIGSPLDLMQWYSLLRSASAFEMYRKAHGNLEISNIIHFLILNTYFPRSVTFCMIQILQALKYLMNFQNKKSHPAEEQTKKLITEFMELKIEKIIELGLHEFLDDLQMKFIFLNNSIAESFFRFSSVN